jgi:regulator of protease activity HflC (stomatin/prohibitin superfamily)
VAYRLKDHYATVDSILLSSITFPDAYVTALSATEAAKQEISTVTFQISQAQTEQQTLILAAQKQAQIVALTANATATSLIYEYAATVTNLQVTTDAQVTALISLVCSINCSLQKSILMISNMCNYMTMQ